MKEGWRDVDDDTAEGVGGESYRCCMYAYLATVTTKAAYSRLADGSGPGSRCDAGQVWWITFGGNGAYTRNDVSPASFLSLASCVVCPQAYGSQLNDFLGNLVERGRKGRKLADRYANNIE